VGASVCVPFGTTRMAWPRRCVARSRWRDALPNKELICAAGVVRSTCVVGVLFFFNSLAQIKYTKKIATKIITIGLAELKAVIVGVFAQYIRLEVDATRTVSMITRDPGKTARLLDNITSRCKQVFPESDQVRLQKQNVYFANVVALGPHRKALAACGQQLAGDGRAQTFYSAPSPGQSATEPSCCVSRYGPIPRIHPRARTHPDRDRSPHGRHDRHGPFSPRRGLCRLACAELCARVRL